MVTKGIDFSRMKVWVTIIGKLFRPREALANGEGNLEGIVREAGGKYQSGREVSCSNGNLVHPLAIFWHISLGKETI